MARPASTTARRPTPAPSGSGADADRLRPGQLGRLRGAPGRRPGSVAPGARRDRGDAGQELARAAEVAGTLAALGCGAIVLACAGTPDRDAVAGRAAPEHALTGDAWRAFVDLVRRAAEAAAERGLRAYFHNHAATYVETPDEVGRLLEAVPAAAMGLCLDTGHYAFGGGEPAQALR